MYQDKSFKAGPIEDIITELDRIVVANGATHVRDVFLADGDAMTLLPTRHLEQTLDASQRDRLPRVRATCVVLLFPEEYTWKILSSSGKSEIQRTFISLCRV